MRLFPNISILLVASSLSACNYLGPYQDNGRVISPTQKSDSAFFEKLEEPPKFSDIYNRIFKRKCNFCHSAGNEAKTILLDLESLKNSNLDLIVPGDAESSQLFIALTRTDTDNPKKKMPPPSPEYPKLTAHELAAIKLWINNGAKD